MDAKRMILSLMAAGRLAGMSALPSDPAFAQDEAKDVGYIKQ